LYKLEKEHEEAYSLRFSSSKDFDSVIKVDTHIHHSACMSTKLLLNFMKRKMMNNSDDVVSQESDGTPITLGEVFRRSNLTVDNLTLDALDMKIFAEDAYHRFDRFNAKYNPAGQSLLREVFLKSSNKLKGKYLAELTKEVFTHLEETVDERVELRISIYGRNRNEWFELSDWIVDNQLYSDRNVWMIQVPRIYTVFRQIGSISSFQDILDNVFTPLFECTKDPSKHPKLHEFLQKVIGFDSVDDESIPEQFSDLLVPPKDWVDPLQNPPYSYYCYYMRANINALNLLRTLKGLNTFSFRPHCGEAGDTQHLEVAFLLADSIAHG
jgi:AMP deaminase